MTVTVPDTRGGNRPLTAATASHAHARVYVSSAAHGLTEARLSVIDAVRRAGCEPVAMEQYGADTRPPLERCLRDVASCDAYIGIVAWRYGSCPPGHKKSFTHLEYDEACRLGKHVLLFHHDEGADWPAKYIDDSRHRVRSLRDAQARGHVVDHFSTIGELPAGVRRALGNLYASSATPVPALLPYVADRQAQQERLASAFGEHELDRSPTLLIVHGAADQAQHKFVEYLQELALGRILGAGAPIVSSSVALRTTDFDEPDVITRRIALNCSVEPTTDIELLSRDLHDFGRLTMLRFPVGVDVRRGRPQTRQVEQLLSYFGRWPRREPLRVLPVISVQYQQASSWTDRVLRRATLSDRLGEVLEAVAADTGAPVVVLPQLTDVEQVEVEVWADRPEVRRFLGDVDLVPAIRRMYADHERLTRERGIPMETLARRLAHLLQNVSPWQEAA